MIETGMNMSLSIRPTSNFQHFPTTSQQRLVAPHFFGQTKHYFIILGAFFCLQIVLLLLLFSWVKKPNQNPSSKPVVFCFPVKKPRKINVNSSDFGFGNTARLSPTWLGGDAAWERRSRLWDQCRLHGAPWVGGLSRAAFFFVVLIVAFWVVFSYFQCFFFLSSGLGFEWFEWFLRSSDSGFSWFFSG